MAAVGAAVRVKLGGPLTVRAIEVLAVTEPPDPVTGSLYFPVATLAAMLIVTLDDAVTGFAEKAAVMPAGQPDAASVTGELNPLVGATVTVDAAWDPTIAAAAVALKLKLGSTGAAPEVIRLEIAEVPVMPLAPVDCAAK